jgi:formate dehydrogenase iron-sulfur subunit
VTDLLAGRVVTGPGLRPGSGPPRPAPVLDPTEYEPTPIDLWLRRQQDLSAVERFSDHHDRTESGGGELGVARYRDRLPATPPAPGQQYAFEVDLDACTGCKACVAACHSLNGLGDDEAWRRVGALHADTITAPPAADPRGSITVTSSCHHCVDPACLSGCPANAYEKDPVTGIVRHLDDSCIGCSYCTLTCPYEVPTFQPSLGIVRKCDMCSDRLADGEAPACVQGCPQGAITIALVDTAGAVSHARDGAPTAVVPSAPDSAITVPTTRYRTSRPVPESWVATDRASVHPSAGHAPLAVMLVLTQAAAGMTVAATLASGAQGPAGDTSALAGAGLVTGLVALAASTMHLGRPLLAWRAILGIRRSWLSREIAAFGLFAGAGVARAGLELVGAPQFLVTLASITAVAGAIAGVACSVQLYAVTHRRWWRPLTSTVRFAGTALVGGAIGTAAVIAFADPERAAGSVRPLAVIALIGLLASIAGPVLPLWLDRLRAEPSADLAGTARLLAGPLRNRHLLRLAAGAVAALMLVGVATATTTAGDARQAGLALVAAGVVAMLGEHQDRRLFFLASVAPRMPGSPR